MRFALELTGATPLVMHNIRLADEDDEIVMEIKKLTSKKTKTKQDRDEIGRLEWYGGLYTDQGKVVMPTENFKRCVAEIAKVRKLGKAVERAMLPLDGLHVPLIHDGPQSLEELCSSDVYRLRKSVGVMGRRVTRVRPRFPAWGLTLSVELLADVMDPGTFVDLVHLAGRAEGLGDGRRIGYGRFSATIKEV
jgi:hypothetical protein